MHGLRRKVAARGVGGQAGTVSARLPDLGPFTRFEFHTIGLVHETNGQPLIELAREHRVAVTV